MGSKDLDELRVLVMSGVRVRYADEDGGSLITPRLFKDFGTLMMRYIPSGLLDALALRVTETYYDCEMKPEDRTVKDMQEALVATLSGWRDRQWDAAVPKPEHTFYLNNGKLDVKPPFTEDTRDSLGWSIKKWQFIVDQLKAGNMVRNDGRGETCALCCTTECLLSCDGCPVKHFTGKSQCDGTYYRIWQDREDLASATAELAFLEAIRDGCPDPLREAYLAGQDAMELKVGDRVRVMRATEDYELGWNLPWNVFKTKQVGKILHVDTIRGNNYGIQVGSGRHYPWFVLEKLSPEPPAKTHLVHVNGVPFTLTEKDYQTLKRRILAKDCGDKQW